MCVGNMSIGRIGPEKRIVYAESSLEMIYRLLLNFPAIGFFIFPSAPV
jgi:hypothetical protein